MLLFVNVFCQMCKIQAKLKMGEMIFCLLSMGVMVDFYLLVLRDLAVLITWIILMFAFGVSLLNFLGASFNIRCPYYMEKYQYNFYLTLSVVLFNCGLVVALRNYHIRVILSGSFCAVVGILYLADGMIIFNDTF